jgi:hypothetical protein
MKGGGSKETGKSDTVSGDWTQRLKGGNIHTNMKKSEEVKRAGESKTCLTFYITFFAILSVFSFLTL